MSLRSIMLGSLAIWVLVSAIAIARDAGPRASTRLPIGLGRVLLTYGVAAIVGGLLFAALQPVRERAAGRHLIGAIVGAVGGLCVAVGFSPGHEWTIARWVVGAIVGSTLGLIVASMLVMGDQRGQETHSD